MATYPIIRNHHYRQDQQQQETAIEHEEALLNYCATCNKSFTRKRDLHRHLRSARAHVNNGNIENGGYPCRMCAKVFTRRDIRQKHEGNRSCMKQYSRFLRDARSWIRSSLPFSLSASPYETIPEAAVAGLSAAENDSYYNSDNQSVITESTQDDCSVDTPSSLSTTTSFSTFS
ncbi:hypothetical protein INT45_004025 [Circinella minor]|uniref:C2H2-type domain-containing protein n=1 Tax=Circinella minor TaxID=1195481 RepID=A0A8H7VH57_9FUNG|nr:hypothetical protein INT45_004025 [Circinella minor]